MEIKKILIITFLLISVPVWAYTNNKTLYLIQGNIKEIKKTQEGDFILLNIEKSYPYLEKRKTINVFVDYLWYTEGVYGQLYPLYNRDSINKWMDNSVLLFVLRNGNEFTTFVDNKKWWLYKDTLPYTPLPNVAVIYKISSVKDTTFESYKNYLELFYNEKSFEIKNNEFRTLIENINLPEMMRFDAILMFSKYLSGYRTQNNVKVQKKDSIIFYPSDPILLENYLLTWLTGEKELKFSGYYLLKIEALYADIRPDYKYSLDRVILLKKMLVREDMSEEDKKHIKGRIYSVSDECNFEINILENRIKQLKLIIDTIK